MIPPALPRLKRSRGSPLPKYRRQMVHAVVRLYEKVRAQMARETIALKPTTGPKLMQVMAEERAMVAQTARRGVSAS